MQRRNVLLVISHYAARTKENLYALLTSLHDCECDVLTVINSDEVDSVRHGYLLSNFPCVFRPNLGMNIGGWDCAFREFPYYDKYIFIQDECVLLNKNFIKQYSARLDEPFIGMIGESINPKWNFDWNAVANTPLNYFIDVQGDGNLIRRIDYYINSMRLWGINPGCNGKHLRALVWAFNREILSNIGGFPIGLSKEECIAAEIAVSKAVEQIGFRVEQVATDPFKFFTHLEWRTDGYSKRI